MTASLGKDLSENSCVFCRIARKETEANIVFKDEDSLAFLDSMPLFLGHCLLIQSTHCETLSDLPKGKVGPLFVNARLIATAVQKGMNADGTFVAISNKVSQSVPHLHIHIVPRRQKDGLKRFFWPRQKYTSREAMQEVQKTIESAISELRDEAKCPN